MKKSSKNPLFVVTNKGQDVEEAKNFFDALVKKFGFEPVLNFLNIILDIIFTSIKGHAGFIVAQKFLDEFIIRLEKLIKKLDPVLAFSLFQH